MKQTSQTKLATSTEAHVRALHAAMGELLACTVLGLGMGTIAFSATSNVAVAVGEALLVVMGTMALRSLARP
jgi:hypothetical protein